MAGRAIHLEKATKRAALSRIGQRRQIIIPKAIFEAMQLKAGDFMEVTAERGRVSMKPRKLIDADDVLTSKETKQLRHGLKQAREGKTRPWDRVKNELGL